MKVIEEWLNSKHQNYTIGCSYYKTFGNDENLKRYFCNGFDTNKKARLIEALKELCNKTHIKKHTRTEVEQMPEGSDSISKAIHKEWLEPYTKMNYIRHSIDELGTNNDEQTKTKRFVLVEEILRLEDECENIWKKRDGFEENKVLPTKKTKTIVIPTTPLELGLFIENCAKQIRKNKPMASTDSNKAFLLDKWLKLYKQASGKDYAFKKN